MTLDEITKAGLDPAFKLLPADMDSKEARVMLLAIALKESLLLYRRQLVGSPPKPTGPAKSFWQAEKGGGMVAGIRSHAATKKYVTMLCFHEEVNNDTTSIWDAIENNDVLAAGLARLLLYSDPAPLPRVGNEEAAWQLYLRTWRPGAYTRGDAKKRAQLRREWADHYKTVLDYVGR